MPTSLDTTINKAALKAITAATDKAAATSRAITELLGVLQKHQHLCITGFHDDLSPEEITTGRELMFTPYALEVYMSARAWFDEDATNQEPEGPYGMWAAASIAAGYSPSAADDDHDGDGLATVTVSGNARAALVDWMTQ